VRRQTRILHRRCAKFVRQILQNRAPLLSVLFCERFKGLQCCVCRVWLGGVGVDVARVNLRSLDVEDCLALSIRVSSFGAHSRGGHVHEKWSAPVFAFDVTHRLLSYGLRNIVCLLRIGLVILKLLVCSGVPVRTLSVERKEIAVRGIGRSMIFSVVYVRPTRPRVSGVSGVNCIGCVFGTSCGHFVLVDNIISNCSTLRQQIIRRGVMTKLPIELVSDARKLKASRCVEPTVLGPAST
jgi:hypothetical protein